MFFLRIRHRTPTMSPTQHERFAGCLIGQCLGDALGFPVEKASAGVCGKYIEEFVKAGKMLANSRGPFAVGQYTDDSQLARELVLSFVACRGFDPSDYASRLATLFVEGRVVWG